MEYYYFQIVQNVIFIRLYYYYYFFTISRLDLIDDSMITSFWNQKKNEYTKKYRKKIRLRFYIKELNYFFLCINLILICSKHIVRNSKLNFQSYRINE